ncbi:tissue factor pathway inhibitor-like [Episyrphus balteatus]|uniref:tissue factor pathway inhibitor-like n=1 Tax=Episyrphus balteatus TaxID=286459 RepID=UPI002485AB97|nr:tissue factor pathway inhibitor-like [Episyrphus balteatus]
MHRICLLRGPQRRGPDHAIKMFYYDLKSNECLEFRYSGRPGNANRFTSLSDCKKAYCRSRPDKGPCNRSITAWAYNPRSKSCDKFYYGGCGGNQNRYKSKSICEQICKR